MPPGRPSARATSGPGLRWGDASGGGAAAASDRWGVAQGRCRTDIRPHRDNTDQDNGQRRPTDRSAHLSCSFRSCRRPSINMHWLGRPRTPAQLPQRTTVATDAFHAWLDAGKTYGQRRKVSAYTGVPHASRTLGFPNAQVGAGGRLIKEEGGESATTTQLMAPTPTLPSPELRVWLHPESTPIACTGHVDPRSSCSHSAGWRRCS